MRALFFDGMVLIAFLCLIEIGVLLFCAIMRGLGRVWRGK